MKAFTNTTMTKEELLKELKWHQEQDNIIKGTYFEDGKGCAVGCSLESLGRKKKIKIDVEDHSLYEEHFGIPEWLARVEDILFEGMSESRSKTFPYEFIDAINIGSNLNDIENDFKIFVLESNYKNFDHAEFPNVKNSLDEV